MSTEAITEAELAAALAEAARRSGGMHYVMPAASAAEVAAEFFKTALSLREPDWKDRARVIDAKGDVWQYAARYEQGGWEAPGVAGTVGFTVPARPLRRLVPLPSRADLIAALEESVAREHGYEGQASRVLALLEGREETCPGGC